MLSKQDARSPTWINQLFAIIEADIRKLRHDPTELFTRMFQPLIWILIFGQAMAYFKTIPSGSLPYLDYMVPGIAAQSILFIAIYYGFALIWEKDIGTLHKILVTPTPRLVLVLGRSFSAGIRGLSQIVMIYVLSVFLGIDLRWDFLSLCGMVAMSFFVAAIFSTFSLMVAAIVKKRERFMGIAQAVTMPLFFASNALYPIDAMPHWIKILSLINPLTYQVDALRTFMIAGQTSHFGLGLDFAVSFFAFAVVVLIATRLYPKILY
jgi:ABC-2 type transport system permease protein